MSRHAFIARGIARSVDAATGSTMRTPDKALDWVVQHSERAIFVLNDLHPFLEVRFTDAQGRALDRSGTFTEGAIDAGFTAGRGATGTPFASVTTVETSEVGPSSLMTACSPVHAKRPTLSCATFSCSDHDLSPKSAGSPENP